MSLAEHISKHSEEFNEEVLSVLHDGIGTYASLIRSDEFSSQQRFQFGIDEPWVLFTQDDQGFIDAFPISDGAAISQRRFHEDHA